MHAHELCDAFLGGIEAVAGARDVLPSLHHVFSLEETFAFVESRPDARQVEQRLQNHLADQGWASDPIARHDVLQLVGACQFWAIGEQRLGLRLTWSDAALTAPTGICLSEPCSGVRFEVKTLSPIEGWRTSDAMVVNCADRRLEAARDCTAALLTGVAAAPTRKTLRECGSQHLGRHAHLCRTLIDSAASSLAVNPGTPGPTLLVLNLMLIDQVADPTQLRPLAVSYPEPCRLRTGALWSLAFGNEEQPVIYRLPDFSGIPSLQGILDRLGVLADDRYALISGMLLVVHPPHQPAEIFGLVRASDKQRWAIQSPSVAKVFFALTQGKWNDDSDSNGWALIKW